MPCAPAQFYPEFLLMSRYVTGVKGEAQVEAFLRNKGMTLLVRRYRAADGEIDLIMQDGACIVFVEVKARPNGWYGDGIAAVTPNKQRRMTHAAQYFLVEREYLERPVRFDVVEITRAGIMHIPNAFDAAW